MCAASRNDARLELRLSSEHKGLIEDAAVTSGQTMQGFVLSTLLREARQVLEHSQITRLTRRDRDRFIAALDEANAAPNKALRKAAARYKKRTG